MTTKGTRAKPEKQTHYSNNQVHKLVARRFKELRLQGLSTQEAMKQARDELQPSDDLEPDAGSQGMCREAVSCS